MRKELLDGEQVFVIHDLLTPEERADEERQKHRPPRPQHLTEGEIKHADGR